MQANMKAISLWNPYGQLIVTGHKRVETRSWPAPRSLIGQRIAIASTKTLKPEALSTYGEPLFQAYYQSTGLPTIFDLPRGAIIGSVLLEACELMTSERISQTNPQERAFGDWREKRYAWRLSEPRILKTPIPVRGRQGIWEFNGEIGV